MDLNRKGKGGARLLQALEWEATHGQGEEPEWLWDLGLDKLVNTAAKDAARLDPERPLAQERARKKYFDLFRDLESAGWGRIVMGRRGHSTRFSFDEEKIGPSDLARALSAAGVERRSLDRLPSAEQHRIAAPSATAPGVASAVRRDEIVRHLRDHADELRRLGVSSLSLFGSVARDEARPDSDVDLLVAFEGPVTSDAFFDAKFFLEDLLGKRIDLVTENALRERVREQIQPELIRVA